MPRNFLKSAAALLLSLKGRVEEAPRQFSGLAPATDPYAVIVELDGGAEVRFDNLPRDASLPLLVNLMYEHWGNVRAITVRPMTPWEIDPGSSGSVLTR
jgi:hypothetical protein